MRFTRANGISRVSPVSEVLRDFQQKVAKSINGENPLLLLRTVGLAVFSKLDTIGAPAANPPTC
jgi:hypothetical protein